MHKNAVFQAKKLALGDFVPNFGKKPLCWVRMRFLCHNYNNSLISTQKFGGFLRICLWPVGQVGYSLWKISKNRPFGARSCKWDISRTGTSFANLRPDLNSPRNCLSFEPNLESSRALDREISRFKHVYIACIKMLFFKQKIGFRRFCAEFRQKTTLVSPDAFFMS